MLFEQVGLGGVVEGDENGVIASADVAVDSAKDGGGEVGSVPGGEGRAEALAELVTNGLGNERHRHLAEANIEVQGAGTFPAEFLIGIEELLDMPALGIMDRQVENLIAIARSEESFVVKSVGILSGALDELAVGGFGMMLEVKGAVGGSPPGPPRLKIL